MRNNIRLFPPSIPVLGGSLGNKAMVQVVLEFNFIGSGNLSQEGWVDPPMSGAAVRSVRLGEEL